MPDALANATRCARHPESPAAFTCRRCGAFACSACEIPHETARECCVGCSGPALAAAFERLAAKADGYVLPVVGANALVIAASVFWLFRTSRPSDFWREGLTYCVALSCFSIAWAWALRGRRLSWTLGALMPLVLGGVVIVLDALTGWHATVVGIPVFGIAGGQLRRLVKRNRQLIEVEAACAQLAKAP